MVHVQRFTMRFLVINIDQDQFGHPVAQQQGVCCSCADGSCANDNDSIRFEWGGHSSISLKIMNFS
ncbi:hypothetical protein D3C71_1665860 [compost metagenome]